MTTTVQPRPWDSTFFGVRVFETHLQELALDEAVAEAAGAGADCLYVWVEADDLPSIQAAVHRGARLVDLRVELGGRLEPAPDGSATPTRVATAADREPLLAQARELASESRFTRDARIPQERVGEMYEIWLDRCLEDGVVAVQATGAGGFVGARREADVARVELVYVDAAARGQGLGRVLVRGAVAALGASDVSVVTQAGNLAAQRLYQSLGLRSRSTVAVLHLWLDELR